MISRPGLEGPRGTPAERQGKAELGDDFPGETEQGAARLAAKVRAALNVRCPGGDAPTTVFVDRGPGFYHPSTGQITAGFKQGLRDNGLRAFMGDDAAEQPGALQELMLHETAVSWIRVKLQRCKPTRPWLETVEQYRARLKSVVTAINQEHNVEGLCWELPDRVEKLRLAKGDRLSK